MNYNMQYMMYFYNGIKYTDIKWTQNNTNYRYA